MRRIILAMLAMGLCDTAGAIEFQLASSIQQNTFQLRTDVAALRTALSQPGINSQSILTAYAPMLLDRARAARSQAATYRQKIEASLESAERKRQAAEVDYHLDNLEAAIQQIGSMIQQTADAAKKVEEVAQRIEEIMPKLLALVGSACTLPHATTTIVNGACAIAACEKGWVNADRNVANGCERPAY